jgi:type 2 lantibiotic biosynthesis protein LanM
MNQPFFQSPAWYQAIALAERMASLREVKHELPNVEINTELAQRRMKRWRKQCPFTKDTCLAERLALDGLTEKEFFNLLGEPIEAVRDRLSHPPAWLSAMEQAFANPAYAYAHTLPPLEMLQGQEATGFLYAVEPLINQGCDQLQEGIQSLIQTQSDLPFDPETIIEVLFAALPDQLLWMLNRTLVLELNVARLQGQLTGNTSEERFQSFLQCLRQRDRALALLQEYPVLARQLTICIQHWVAFSLEFLQHLCTDWGNILTTFSPEKEPGQLLVLQGGAGDSHRGGRSVLIAKFSSGFQLVYKPRSLAVDVHFQELLAWINDKGTHPPFQTLKVLDCASYGWVEFVSASSCNTPEEVQRFYESQGGYLALLYALEATDFHCENLIADGEHPILIDLESLFHPHCEQVNLTDSDLLTNHTMAYSVLNVGLLPQRIWLNAEYEGVDMSGLGSARGQLTPHRVPYWEGTGTDEMQVKRKRIEMSGEQNQPTWNGTEINVLNYTESFLAGFINIYRLLLKHRDELLHESGPIARFTEDEVRVILRPTYFYSLLLTESFHPHLLGNALDRDRHFDHLWEEIEQCPYLAKVIAAERNDLWQSDIPMFTTHPHSRDIWSSSNQRIADFFDESGMTLVQRRLQQLSEADLTQQLWFIRASLTTLTTVEEQTPWPSYPLTEPQNNASKERLLTAAKAIGDRLEALALRGEQDASWIGLMLLNEKHWILSSLDIDLYAGLPGVILFLAYLGIVTNQERYTALAKAALTTLQRQISNNKESIVSIGAFEGWGGVIYTLTQLGVLWNESELLNQAESLVNLLPPLINEDKELDITGGAAGCIASLISLYRCRPSQQTLTAAIKCGDHLITQAKQMERGIGWVPKSTGEKPLSGFSHGTAGLAWALLELASLTGEQRFQTTALAAIEYERSLFCPEVGNWSDLRNFADTVLADKDSHYTCKTAWCHGAPGIGLARLRSLPHVDDAESRAEINTALKTTMACGFGYNHSLCHGDLGNLELLLQASQTLNDPQWKTQVDRLAAIILESIEKHGWLCGVPLKVETPGLMNGLAGIGYGLLRLAEPTQVPSILVLESPTLHPQRGHIKPFTSEIAC